MDLFSVESEWIYSVSAFSLERKSFLKEQAIFAREIQTEWNI